MTKKAAGEFAAKVTVQQASGEFVSPAAARGTVADLGVEWLGRQAHLKPSAYRVVESAWRLHVKPVWGYTAVKDIRKTQVQQWVVDLGAGRGPALGESPRKPLGATGVIRAYGVLASILDDAVDDRRILTNPARGVNLPRKVKKPHVYLNHAQAHDLAGASKYPALVLLLAYCGLRWGEASALRVKRQRCG
ncbi:hypothetical protein [Arthrobacter sp. NPDC090010]|uniref:hypothetical protein n=1 Tax=Arthrobacter sp. NPDC090010 TaxID=3363942 RepID=UPI0037F8A59E